MSQTRDDITASIPSFPEAQRHDFVAPTKVLGSFAQPDPQPVIFTSEFNRELDNLAKDVAAAVAQHGASGSRFR